MAMNKKTGSGWMAQIGGLALGLSIAWASSANAADEAATHSAASAQLFDRAESLKSADNAEFQRVLVELDRNEGRLDSSERWHLQYLHAWQHVFDGDLQGATSRLLPIIERSGDPTLRFRATATLINILGTTHHYVQAFERLNELMSQLPDITDKAARFQGLGEAAQLLNLAGQYDLAIQYANQMVSDLPPGEGPCRAQYHALYAKYRSGVATSSDTEFTRMAAICDQVGQQLVADSLRADVADMAIKEGKVSTAIAMLEAHMAEVQRVGFPFLTSQFHELLARAYLIRKQPDRARAQALLSISAAGNDQQYEPLSEAYKILYEISRQQGSYAEALSWHEKYMAAQSGYLNDISARALAFQRVKQQVDARRQQVEGLNAQNRILQLQQALDRKAVQASRLSIVLLLTVLASVVFWLVRLKRSQKRFMRLARHDGLTGIFNRQHFVEQAERMLAAAQRDGQHVCLLLMDLDHFKLINDAHGHAFGDLVLKRAVAVCHDHLRKSDIFGRLGGEEFGILLPGCRLANVSERAEAIRITIAETSDDEDTRGVVISASLGVASTEYAGYDLQQLMADADNALYRAKRAGRNRVVLDTVEWREPASG